MKTWKTGALLGALALAACGRGAGGGGGAHGPAHGPADDPAPDPVAVTTPASTPGDCPDGVTVRLIGTNQGDVTQLWLTAAGAGVSCAVAPVCSNTHVADGVSLDLASDAKAWDLVTFDYPPAGYPAGGAPMTLQVDLGTGTVRTADSGGTVASCGTSIFFSFDPARIDRHRCSITILLDVGRSIVPTPGGFTLVPQYRVFF